MEDRREYQQDALLARVRTSGILVEQYEIGGRTFELYDVGGQRNERRKWIHCFENVTAVIFVAAISEYNQKLFEDATTNRMLEAPRNRVASIAFLNARERERFPPP